MATPFFSGRVPVPNDKENLASWDLLQTRPTCSSTSTLDSALMECSPGCDSELGYRFFKGLRPTPAMLARWTKKETELRRRGIGQPPTRQGPRMCSPPPPRIAVVGVEFSFCWSHGSSHARRRNLSMSHVARACGCIRDG